MTSPASATRPRSSTAPLSAARSTRSSRPSTKATTPSSSAASSASFGDRLREHGLPLPRTNRRLDHRYVDCRWPDHALTVELNSFTYHRSRHAWEEDYDRERAARARGDEFRRYTWRDVVEDPAPMFVDLQSLLVGTVTA